MTPLRVLTVDDEPLVRRGVARFLEQSPDVTWIGEARDGAEAVALIERHAPDLVLLDVQMPEMDGFEVLAQIEPDRRPAVVFITAYDQYALRAFEVHAVDYLLKPFDDDRLATAIARARERLAAPPGEDGVDALVREHRAQRTRVERFMVRSGGRIYFVDAREVDWFEAADNYVRLHVGDRPHLVRDTIKHLASKLDPSLFVRIHRSTIVNISRIRELRPLPSGDGDIVLSDGVTLRLSRSFREPFERVMVQG